MLAVTTRNKLKSARFLVPMLIARKRVRAQLGQTRGLMRWADAIASPTEFYTLTCWANKHVMFNFMSSDAHRDLMWLFTKWSDEFWSMRWSPSECEIGDWNGMHFARRGNQAQERRPQTPIPEIAKGPRPGAGPIDPSACPVMAVMALMDVHHFIAARKLLQIWCTLKQPRLNPLAAFSSVLGGRSGQVLLRWAIGSVEINQYLLVMLWQYYDEQVPSALADTLQGEWLMAWRPGDYEIGHWNGLRLRHFARRAQPQLMHVA